jgi:iron complex outermembrane recepter protein
MFHKRKLATIMAAVWASNVAAQPQASQPSQSIEEVRVTGSFIRRSQFQQSSPVDTFDNATIEVSGPQHLAYFFNDLPYNMNSNITQGRGAISGGGTINLRNLGSSASLVLLNTRRAAAFPLAQDNTIDINTLVPGIMIERIEILKDGASAIYGTDAVGGVVNFLTRDNFEGFEVSARGSVMDYNNRGDQEISALWGSDLGDTHIVAAFEYHHQDLVQGTEMEWDRNRVFNTPLGAPGSYIVPRRNASGALTGTSFTTPDVDCDRIPGSSTIGTRCNYDFWPAQADINEIDRYTTYIRAKRNLTENIRLTGEFAYSDMLTKTIDTPSASIAVPISIPGHHPGNIYRAVNVNGLPLYAVPSGVQLGYDKDGNGVNEFLPQRISGNPLDFSSRVLLAPNPTDPASGVPFWEDVGYSGRTVGSQGGLPTGGTWGVKDYVRNRPTLHYSDISRFGLVLDGDLNDVWHWESGLTLSKYKAHSNFIRNDTNVPEFKAALIGYGGLGCNPAVSAPGAGLCSFFNPFGSNVFATPGSILANTQEMIDRVQPALWDNYETRLITWDALVTRDLFELPAGPLAVAVGGQVRDERLVHDYDILRNLGQTDRGAAQDDLDVSRKTKAVFTEFNIPAISNNSFGNLEFNAALRHETSDNFSTTDPKLGVIYTTPSNIWLVRGSWGQSFLAPSLYQNFISTSGLGQVNDVPVAQGGTGIRELRVTVNRRGNPDLRPQISTAYTVGFRFQPLDNLMFDIGYWNFQFEGQLQLEGAQAILNLFPTGPQVTRDPTTNIPLVVDVAYFNAGFVETAGIDFEFNYNHDLNTFGTLDLNVLGTYVPTYDVKALPTSPVVDASDSNNIGVLGASTSIDWRVNTRLTWRLDQHSLNAVYNYTDSFKNLGPGPANFKAWTSLNLTYNYSFAPTSFDGEYVVSLGVQNAFNEQPQLTAGGAIAPGASRNEGRIYWGSVTARF